MFGFLDFALYSIISVMLVVIWVANRPGELSMHTIEICGNNAKTNPDRKTYVERLNDCHWNGRKRRLVQLDHEDQRELLTAIIYWFDINDSAVPDYNQIAEHITCEYGQMIDVLFYMAGRCASEQLTVTQIRGLTAHEIYQWMLEFRN